MAIFSNFDLEDSLGLFSGMEDMSLKPKQKKTLYCNLFKVDPFFLVKCLDYRYSNENKVPGSELYNSYEP